MDLAVWQMHLEGLKRLSDKELPDGFRIHPVRLSKRGKRTLLCGLRLRRGGQVFNPDDVQQRFRLPGRSLLCCAVPTYFQNAGYRPRPSRSTSPPACGSTIRKPRTRANSTNTRKTAAHDGSSLGNVTVAKLHSLFRFRLAAGRLEIPLGELQEGGKVNRIGVAAGMVAEGQLAGDKRRVGRGHLRRAQVLLAQEAIDRPGGDRRQKLRRADRPTGPACRR